MLKAQKVIKIDDNDVLIEGTYKDNKYSVVDAKTRKPVDVSIDQFPELFHDTEYLFFELAKVHNMVWLEVRESFKGKHTHTMFDIIFFSTTLPPISIERALNNLYNISRTTETKSEIVNLRTKFTNEGLINYKMFPKKTHHAFTSQHMRP